MKAEEMEFKEGQTDEDIFPMNFCGMNPEDEKNPPETKSAKTYKGPDNNDRYKRGWSYLCLSFYAHYFKLIQTVPYSVSSVNDPSSFRQVDGWKSFFIKGQSFKFTKQDGTSSIVHR